MRWRHTQLSESRVSELCRNLALHPIVANLLLGGGLTDTDKVKEFLRPLLRNLDDPFKLTNLDSAVSRLREAMARGERMLVFGDYDVDGITSTTLFISILRQFGIYPRYHVPQRLKEGYGLSFAALERALGKGIPDLLIAVDCGTNSRAEVQYLTDRGIDVIIVDHHTARDNPPRNCILVNPHVNDRKDAPWRELCSVGLVFKLVHGLLKQLREEGAEEVDKIRLKDYLDLVAMGTIADLVPLLGENRILARAGLRRLGKTRKPGLNALFEVSGMTLGKVVSPFDVSFRLSPRINACGRLADAGLPIDMLLSDDWSFCYKAARQLNDLNRERQDIERRTFLEAEAFVTTHLNEASGYVLYNVDWHPGVVGIVASRLTQKFNRPSIVMGTEGALAKGSGRSIPGLDLMETLHACKNCLESWGGHPMAVGITLHPDQIPLFQKIFDETVALKLGGALPERQIEIACWIEQSDIGADLLEELQILQPFGQGNPEPIFGLRKVILKNPPEPFGNGHFRFQLGLDKGRSVPGVAWKKSDRIPPAGQFIEMALKLNWNIWNGRKFLQAELIDWRPAGES